jgi:hypothetical protein
MAVLTPTVITFGTRTAATMPLYAGINGAATLTAADVAGDSFPNDGRTFFRIKNAGSLITAIFAAVKPSDQGISENIAANIAASTGDVWFGPFPANEFNDTNGRVNVTYSGVTTVTVMPYRLAERGRG